jgi:hypothetical protein
MVKRAQSIPSGPHRRRVGEFTNRLSKKQLGWLGGVTTVIHDYETEISSGPEPAEIAQSDIFELLQVVDVVVKGNAEEIEAQAIGTFLSGTADAPMVFSILRDLAAGKARTRGSWDCKSLHAALVAQGVSWAKQAADTSDLEVEREGLEQELEIHKRNLNTLRRQAAIYGAGAVPLHLLNQIEHEEQAIRGIERELGK